MIEHTVSLVEKYYKCVEATDVNVIRVNIYYVSMSLTPQSGLRLLRMPDIYFKTSDVSQYHILQTNHSDTSNRSL